MVPDSAQPPPGSAGEPREPLRDDDLFAFDESRAGRGRKPPTAPKAPNPPTRAPQAVASSTGRETPPPAGIATAPVREHPRESGAAPRFPTALRFALLGMVLLNVGALVAATRSQGLLSELAEAVRRQGANPVAARGQEPARSAPLRGTPPRVEVVDGRSVLGDARNQLDAGEFEAARRKLHALLADADHLDPADRNSVCAQASLLIGDAYRLQAEALSAKSSGGRQ
jgi:hypothetical protein